MPEPIVIRLELSQINTYQFLLEIFYIEEVPAGESLSASEL